MKIRISRLNPEHFFGIFLAMFWGRDIICSYATGILLRIPYIKYVANYTFPVLMFICLCLALPYFTRSISRKDILFAGVVTVVYLSNILIFPENKELITIAGTFFFSVFPLYFIGLRFEASKHLRMLYIISIVNIWAFAAYYMLLGGGDAFISAQGSHTSYMGRAYVLLPQLVCVLIGVLNRKNFLNIATALVGFVFLLMCGNRGSLILLLLFVALYLLFNTGEKTRAYVVYVYVGVLAVLGVIAYYHKILITALIAAFSKYGWSVRVFERLLDATFFKSGGRSELISKLTSAILENPVVGYGLCSDRTITGQYAHNYALELWTAFGMIFGSIILIITVVVIVGAWIKSKDKNSRSFLLLLICLGFLKLFISNSFLLEGLFFMLIGYCVTQLRRNRFAMAELGEDEYENL